MQLCHYIQKPHALGMSPTLCALINFVQGIVESTHAPFQTNQELIYEVN
jgi:hypothetical protein